MNKPFIPMDSDSFIPGKPPFSPAELDELKQKYESSSPSQPGPHKQVADVINDEEQSAPAAPVAKTEPVAAPVPVKKKKVIITDMNTGVRKIEYR